MHALYENLFSIKLIEYNINNKYYILVDLIDNYLQKIDKNKFILNIWNLLFIILEKFIKTITIVLFQIEETILKLDNYIQKNYCF